MKQITLKPGDCVKIADIDLDLFRRLYDAFVAAGAIDMGSCDHHNGDTFLGWDSRDDELWCMGFQSMGFTGRILEPNEILNATNAGQGESDRESMNPTEALREAINHVRFLADHLEGRMSEGAVADMRMKADEWEEALTASAPYDISPRHAIVGWADSDTDPTKDDQS